MVVGQTGEYADVLVIGGGPGGYSAAIRAAQLGRSVVLVEKQRIGGVCLNEGCIPSKALLSASLLYSRMRKAAAVGIDADPKIDFDRMRSWKDGVVRRLSEGVGQLLKRYDVRLKTGTAYFASDHRVAIEHQDDFEFVDFGGAIVASGSRPLAIEGIPFDAERVVSPEGALALSQVPERMAVVGGGYIGLEVATAFSRLGSAVTIVQSEDRVLAEMDPAIGQTVSRSLRSLGVKLLVGAQARAYSDGVLHVEMGDGTTADVEAGVVVAAVGRAPNTEELGLDRASVRIDADGGIEVDERCRSSAKLVYAVGDVAGGPLVAQRAIAQGRVAAEALSGLPAVYDPTALPLVYFTEPEVMSVGFSEQQARTRGFDTVAARFPFGASGRAATLDDQQGFIQVVAERGNGRVIGIHAAGAGVSELAGEATLAIELGATLEDLSLTIHPHPTLSEGIPEAAWLALDIPLHVFHAR